MVWQDITTVNSPSKLEKIWFFLVSYFTFTVSLSFFGALFVSLQKGSTVGSFGDTFLMVIKELYFFTPDRSGLRYVLFIIALFLICHFFYCVHESYRSKKPYYPRALLSFGILLPFSTVIVLHVLNLVI
jgi:hypothetical protein